MIDSTGRLMNDGGQPPGAPQKYPRGQERRRDTVDQDHIGLASSTQHLVAIQIGQSRWQ